MHRENKDGSYNIRGYGGAREGAGRPPTGRKRVFLYVTEPEHTAIRQLLEKMRHEAQMPNPS
jgi:hypothetical protein